MVPSIQTLPQFSFLAASADGSNPRPPVNIKDHSDHLVIALHLYIKQNPLKIIKLTNQPRQKVGKFPPSNFIQEDILKRFLLFK